MKRFLVITICLLMILSMFAGCGAKKGPFSVGYAKSEINPETSIPLGGLGDSATRFSGKIMDTIYTTCVAVTDEDGNSVLLLGVDLLNTHGGLFSEIRQNISKETGIPYNNIMFSATHTHSAPDLNIEYDPGAITQYHKLLSERCLQVAKDALDDRAPAKMYATFARPEGLNFVRHYVLDDGSYRGFKMWEVQKQIVGHPHKADNLLQLVKFERENDKKPVVMINWQAHYASADDVNYHAVSSDYPGILRAEVEKNLDCYAAFFLGGAGNVSSGSRIEGECVSTDYKDHGQKLAQYAVEAAATFKEISTGKIQVMERALVSGDMAPPSIYAISFGDFACVFAPFEVFDNNAKNVRESSKFKYTFYASISNAGWGNRYLPDKEAYRYPAYESCGHGQPDFQYAVFPAGTAELLEAEFIEMLDELFVSSGNELKERDEGYITPEFVPVSDGFEYTNPNPGDFSSITEGTGGNNLYCFKLFKNNTITKVLADSRETAELVLAQTKCKLLFDERNVIVGIAE